MLLYLCRPKRSEKACFPTVAALGNLLLCISWGWRSSHTPRQSQPCIMRCKLCSGTTHRLLAASGIAGGEGTLTQLTADGFEYCCGLSFSRTMNQKPRWADKELEASCSCCCALNASTQQQACVVAAIWYQFGMVYFVYHSSKTWTSTVVSDGKASLRELCTWSLTCGDHLKQQGIDRLAKEDRRNRVEKRRNYHHLLRALPKNFRKFISTREKKAPAGNVVRLHLMFWNSTIFFDLSNNNVSHKPYWSTRLLRVKTEQHAV